MPDMLNGGMVTTDMWNCQMMESYQMLQKIFPSWRVIKNLCVDGDMPQNTTGNQVYSRITDMTVFTVKWNQMCEQNILYLSQYTLLAGN